MTLALLAGCTPRNSCEFWSSGTGGSSERYYCWADEYRDFCESDGGPIQSAFFADQSCADLGYVYQCTQDEIGEGALQDEWTAGPNCDSSVPPDGRTPGSGGSDGPCLVGIWATNPIDTCLGQVSTLTFGSDGTGITNTPECTGQCALSDSFVELTWSADGEAAGTLTMTYGRTVTCGQENPADSVTISSSFSCEGGSATIDGTPWNRQ